MRNVAENPITELRLDLAWRMLATLGAPVHAEPLASTPVDPECAILLGAMSAHDDPRIGEATGWLLRTTSRSLSVARTTALAERFGDESMLGTDFIGTIAANAPNLRQWARAFSSTPDGGAPLGEPTDRLMHRLGADEASTTTLTRPGAYRLRMRMAFGVGARTEALAALVVRRHSASTPEHAWMTVPDLERATSFGARHLLDQLPDMSRAGLLDHARQGRAHRYRARPNTLAMLTPIPTRWIDWPTHVAVLRQLEASMRVLESNPTAAGAMDAARLVPTNPDVIPESFTPHGDPETLPGRLNDWLIASAKQVTSIE